MAWGWVLGIGLLLSLVGALGISSNWPRDPNADARALLRFADGDKLKVKIPGEPEVGYFVKISETSYSALESGGWIEIGRKRGPLSVDTFEKPK